jgi:hypothetical protein
MVAAQLAATFPLDRLSKAHPRLLFHDSEMVSIREAVRSDPFLSTWYRQQLVIGERLLSIPPDVYDASAVRHRDLLATARDLEGRIFTLAGLYRLNSDRRFARRAIEEMLAASSFPDWNPNHFLDDAEITASLGIGYDWLYDVLTPTERTTIRTAIATKGLDRWLARMDAGQTEYLEHNNWNQVCNGGESVGALAIAEDEPVRARRILDHAQSAITNVMKLFAPDGGFEEGPGYWNYATSYNALYIAALDSAVGSDFGASQATGFDRTVDYHIQCIGPSLQSANFGDAHPEVYPSPQVFWFARRFHRPFYAAYERPIVLNQNLDPVQQKESNRFSMLGLLWAAQPLMQGDRTPLPLEQSFSRVAQAYMRGRWNDPKSWFVGFKGGDAQASHGHLDLGSFVFDALGQRWAADLSGDSYSLPGYFGDERWNYYRMRTEGHNTLTVDGRNQDLDAKAPIVATSSAMNNLFAVADLSQAYKGRLSSWKRGVRLLGERRILVQDEFIPASAPVNVIWNLHTYAEVKITSDGRAAMLTRNGQSIQAQILSPASARFSTVSARMPPPQASNEGVTNLVIALDRESAAETTAVLFSEPQDATSPRLTPLNSWH